MSNVVDMNVERTIREWRAEHQAMLDGTHEVYEDEGEPPVTVEQRSIRAAVNTLNLIAGIVRDGGVEGCEFSIPGTLDDIAGWMGSEFERLELGFVGAFRAGYNDGYDTGVAGGEPNEVYREKRHEEQEQ